MTAYGALWTGTSSPTLTRLNTGGSNLTVGTTVQPWGGMQRCNVNDQGIPVAWCTSSAGGCGYDDYGSNGQVMVRVPAFYQYTDTTGYTATATSNAQASSGQAVIDLTSTTGFTATAHPVVFITDGTNIDYGIISSVGSSPASITLGANLAHTYASGATVTEYTTARWISNALGDSIPLQNTNLNPNTHTITAADLHPAFIVDGVAKPYALVGAYEGYISSSKLQSIAGVTPTTVQTKATHRTAAELRGAGWELMTIQMYAALQSLETIEYASLNSQTTLGNGVSTGSLINTGYTATAGTAPSGNASYGSTSVTTAAMSYRGVENVYANIWKFVEGLRCDTSGNYWIAPQTNALTYSDSGAPSTPYINTGSILPAGASLPTNVYTTGALSWAFLPSAEGGSVSTYFPDASDLAAIGTNEIFIVGNAPAMGTACGLFAIGNVASTATYYSAYYPIGARLQYFPQ